MDRIVDPSLQTADREFLLTFGWGGDHGWSDYFNGVRFRGDIEQALVELNQITVTIIISKQTSLIMEEVVMAWYSGKPHHMAISGLNDHVGAWVGDLDHKVVQDIWSISIAGCYAVRFTFNH